MSTSASPRTLLIRGAAVVPVDETIGVLDPGDILIAGDLIAAVGSDLSHLATPDTEVLDGAGLIAVPGFVDPHIHAWEGQLRGAAPTADFAGYLGLTAFGMGPRYRPQDVYAGTLATALAALNAGITTLVDNAHSALTADHSAAGLDALRDAGIRGVLAVGSPFGADLDHVPKTAAALRDARAGGLLDVRLFDINPTPELWGFAKAAGLWVSSEIGRHTPGLTERFEELHRLGLLTPEHAFNHCYDLTERTWELIGSSGASVNLCPRSDAAFGLGSTLPPVASALASGAAVGLSNDNEVSYGINPFAEMQTLLLRDRGECFRRGAEPSVLQPADLLRFATLGGAHNAGLAAQIGSLTPGKQADIVLVRRDGVAILSAADATTVVTTMAHPGMVDTVLVAGQVRKRSGRLVGVEFADLEGLLAASRRYLTQQ